MLPADHALVKVGRELKRLGYRFTAVTPETHRRVLAHPRKSRGASLRDIFGWNLPFSSALVPPRLWELLQAANVVVAEADAHRSVVRFASLEDGLYVHSAFPTSEPDAIFFGPDTYRFASLLRREVAHAGRCVDIGCGSGAGGLSIASRVDRLVLADINPRALRHAAINAAINADSTEPPRVELAESDILASVRGEIDLIIANPPYLVDPRARTYRHGGGKRGVDIALRIVQQGLSRLSAGGKLVLYTGTPVVEGEDLFWRAVSPLCEREAARVVYREIDPDVFGEELERDNYADVDRLAVVSLTVCKAG